MIKNILRSLSFVVFFALSQTSFAFAMNDTLELILPTDLAIKCGETKSVPVTIKNFSNIKSLKFSLEINGNILFFQSVGQNSSVSPQPTATTQGANLVSVNWSSNMALTFVDFTTAFELVFKANKGGGQTTPLTFKSIPTNIEAINNLNQIVPVKVRNGSLKIVDEVAPVATCPLSQTYFVPVSTDTTLSNITASVLDNCGVGFISNYAITGTTTATGTGDATGVKFKTGVSNVMYTATDEVGNKSQCAFQVIVKKNKNVTIYANSPMVTCGDSIVKIDIFASNAQNLGSFQFKTLWNTTAFSYKRVENFASILNYQANGSGNTGVNLTEIAAGKIEMIAPLLGTSISVPNNIRLFTLVLKVNSKGSGVIDFENVDISNDAAPPTTIPADLIPSTIIVEDKIFPTITCPADVEIFAGMSGTGLVPVPNIDAVAADNCGLKEVKYTLIGATNAVGTGSASNLLFAPGMTNVAYDAQDYSFNVKSCAFKVKVKRLALQLQNDTIACNTNTYKIKLRVRDFKNVGKIQYSINFNPAKLGYVASSAVIPNSAISAVSTISASNAATGKILVGFNNASSFDLPDGDVLLELTFNVLDQTLGASHDITIADKDAEQRNPTATIPMESKDGKVTILDKIAPVVANCPLPITLNIVGCDTIVTWQAITATDNCGGSVNFTQNFASGNVFPVGKTTVSYSFTDVSMNKSYCEFDVIVKDKIAPTITSCPTDTIKILVGTGNCEAAIPAFTPSVIDNCAAGTTITQSPTAGTKFPPSIQKVTFTVTDKGGNSAICVRYVKIADEIKPVFVGLPSPPFQLIPAEAGKCGAKASWTKPTATDNCTQNATVLQDKQPLDFFNVGLDSVQFTALDDYFNKSTSLLKIKIFDSEPPKFKNCSNGSRDTILYLTAGDCDVIFTPITLKATDNCIVGEFNVNPNNAPSNKSFSLGKTTLNYIAKDWDLPAQTLCQFNVIVLDTIKPTIVCPSDVTQNTGVTCSASYTLPNATATDNCTASNKITILADYNLNIYNTGTRVVTFTAADSSGNKATCQAKVTVKDIILPSITFNLPNGNSKQVTIQAGSNSCDAIFDWITPTVNENCKLDTVYSNIKPNSVFPLGTTTVIYTAKDKSGNVAVDSFKVTVIDNEKPQPNSPCPSNFVNVPNELGKCGATFKFPDYTDNCTAKSDLKMTINGVTPMSNFFTYPGTYPLTLSVKDKSGNESTCQTVITLKDEEKPVPNCPNNVSVTAVNGACDYTFTALTALQVPIFTDACDGNITKIDTIGFPKGAKFPSGTTTLTFKAKDKAGNESVCSYTVTVSGSAAPIIDNTTCKDIILELKGNKCDTTLGLLKPITTYSCSGKDTETYTIGASTSNVGLSYNFSVGEKTVLYAAKNISGLTSTCSFKVIVKETTPPTFDAFPATITEAIPANSTNCKVKVSWATPMAKDNCGTPTVEILSPIGITSGSEFPIGTQVVVFKATDNAGNTAIRSMLIVVTDKIAPVFTACPTKEVVLSVDGTKITDTENQILSLAQTATCDGLTVMYKPFTANDNCDPIVDYDIQLNQLPGKTFPLGKSTITWIASDKSKNTAVCSMVINILPLKKAKASVSEAAPCVGESVQLSAEAVTNATYNWTGVNNFSSNQKDAMVKNVTLTSTGKYAVNYSVGACKSAFDTVSIVVLAAPSVNSDEYTVESGKVLTNNITTNDVLLDKKLTYKVKLAQDLSNPNAGTLVLNPDGTFTFTSKAGFVGEVVFKYNLCYDDCPDACANDKSVKITVTPTIDKTVTIPTLFSPNGDGINDELLIAGIAGKTSVKLTVFSQWGEEVYRSDTYKNDWKGTWNDKDLPDGTYYYIFQLDAQSEVKKGFVNIFR